MRTAGIGLLWNADDASDDLPFVRKVGGRRMAIVPRTSLATNDLVCWFRAVNSPEVYFEGFKATFNYLYEEGRRSSPKWVEIILHCDIGSRPPRMQQVERIFAYLRDLEEVWYARRRDVATWVLGHRG